MKPKTIFLLVAPLCFGALIAIAILICTLANINQIIGVLLSISLGISILNFVYEKNFFTQYSIEKI